jgi:myo-inositol-1(or 4)-monophosphatase
MQPMLNIANTAARKAGQLILRASEELDMVRVEEKGKNDFVSEVDRRAEARGVDAFRKSWSRPKWDVAQE